MSTRIVLFREIVFVDIDFNFLGVKTWGNALKGIFFCVMVNYVLCWFTYSSQLCCLWVIEHRVVQEKKDSSILFYWYDVFEFWFDFQLTVYVMLQLSML
jgi:hypothetical protein